MSIDVKLKRSLSLPVVALYGLGNILGAGIYVLVGKVADYSGASTTLAFLIAMVTAAFTAFSYMELAGRYPVSASVSVYLHKAFGKRWLSVLIGLAMVAGGIASAAALSQGFAGYLSSFVAVPTVVASVGLLVLLGAIAIKGIGESAKTAAIFTVIEVLGLLLIIWFGRSAFGQADLNSAFTIDPAVGLSGVVAGAFLAFYAFIGFEDMVNVAEEAKNPRRTMPLAILIAIATSMLLYLLVVIVSTTLVKPAELADSSAPLTLVFERSGATSVWILTLIGMVATINGVIVQIIMGSRILYGLANQGWITSRLAQVHKKNKTPVTATLVVVGIMIAGTILLPLVSLAQLTSLLVLSIFTLVNVSLVVIKRRGDKHQGYITVPSFVPYVGAALCICTIAYQLFNWSN
ncbi:amino acid permease [Candidatus Saccharibacteria bacterium]|nr:MAG: amino acid permease [Candidatus Saccharibacteria bacterium]